MLTPEMDEPVLARVARAHPDGVAANQPTSGSR